MKTLAFILGVFVLLSMFVGVGSTSDAPLLSLEVYDMDTRSELCIDLNGVRIYTCTTDPRRDGVYYAFAVSLNLQEANNLTIYNPITAYCIARNVKVTANGETLLFDGARHILQKSKVDYAFGTRDPEENPTFVLFSDVHIPQGRGDDGLTAVERLSLALTTVSKDVPLFVLGDIYDSGELFGDKDAYCYGLFNNATADYVRYGVKGNHDANVVLFSEMISPLCWAAQYGDVLFVGISSLNNNFGEIKLEGLAFNDTTYNFLNGVVNSPQWAASKYRFLLMHYNLDLTWNGGAWGISARLGTYAAQFSAVFHGHEGGGVQSYTMLGTPIFKTSHWGGGRSDTYLRLTETAAGVVVQDVNFVTNTTTNISLILGGG